MSFYIIKRIFLLIPVLLGITFISFLILRTIPGDPALVMAGERGSQEDIEKIRRHLGADRTFLEQYSGYILMLLRGELGVSYYTGRPVLDDIKERLPNTALLAFSAILIAVPAGLLAGFIAGIRQGSLLDKLISAIAVTGLSIPVFWIGLILMYTISLELKLLPPSGTGLRFLLLPAITLAIPAVGAITRITRTMVIDISSMPFVRTAIAKGISPFRLYLVYMMRNIIIPVITVIGIDFGSYLSGAVLTETIFGWNGIGRLTFEGIIKRDYPVVMGCIIISTFIFITINLLVDILYHYLDPRVRLGNNRE
ncbi:MAG: ABC transporter permease [Thermodesulfovibrionales bacterium]|nr:ABC transporter permease [Thermodesulfovibrionales bacterium]